MKVLRTINELTQFVENCKGGNLSLGLVPTMGALHEGHLSLVDRAIADNDAVVVSLFVNPTQFNNPHDLETYPRNEEADFALLEKAGASAVFAPSVEEIYPGGERESKVFRLGSVAEVMEGKHRPGHFQGVAQIVNKLFLLVKPDKAYFGEKDFQQIAVIRQMVKTENLPVEIVDCPIKRGADGLALSSRNLLLTKEQREKAPELHRALKESVECINTATPEECKKMVTDRLNSIDELQVEYYEIVDGITLQPIANWSDSEYIVGCLTCYCGKVRLIDNITYKKNLSTKI